MDKSKTVKPPDEQVNWKYVFIISLASSLFVAVWLLAFRYIHAAVWENELVATNRWMTPILAIGFSFIVGFLVKRYQAPNCIDGSVIDSFKGGSEAKPKGKPLVVTTIMSIVSLLSGAVVGPEGAIGHFAVEIASWFNKAFSVPPKLAQNNILASLSSAYNGLLESPIFTAVLANDINDAPAQKITLASNLISGALGYFIFLLLGNKGFADYLHLENLNEFHLVYIVYTIVFSLIGVVLALITGFAFRMSTAFFKRFDNRIILRSLIAGAVFGVVGFFFPIIIFSGEDQIFSILSNPHAYGVGVLLLMAVVKLMLLSVAFKSGFLGGPTFPTIFASVCVALAINILFPHIPLILIISGVMTGLLMMLFKLPFMVILLSTFFLAADTTLIALIIVSAATVMLIQPKLARFQKP